MTLLRCIILLQFATTLALGQLAPKQPEALVQSLYRKVVARQPVGIPRDADMTTFAPYLSKALLHRIDLAIACESDYSRQHQNPNEKPPFDWLEFGLFSGGNERTSPRAFHIERTQSEKDGSFRVYVRLTWGLPPEGPEIWHISAIVVREESHFVLDDVIFLKDETMDAELRLSEILASGCDGGRWVGYSKQENYLKRQR
jgi:hypothetical protein